MFGRCCHISIYTFDSMSKVIFVTYFFDNMSQLINIFSYVVLN